MEHNTEEEEEGEEEDDEGVWRIDLLYSKLND